MATSKKPRAKASATPRLDQLLEAENGAEAVPVKQYHLVVDRLDAEGPSCQSYESVEELRAAMLPLLDEDEVWVFAFSGTRLHVTEGPYRYLVCLEDTGIAPMPLFHVPQFDTLAVETTGRLSRLPEIDEEPIEAEVADDEQGEYVEDEDVALYDAEGNPVGPLGDDGFADDFVATSDDQ